MLKLAKFLVLAIAVCQISADPERDERDIFRDIGTMAGKVVGKVWRTVMPSDIVKGSVVGAEDKEYHGTPEFATQGGGYPGGYPGGAYPPPYGYPPPGWGAQPGMGNYYYKK